ncbi:MAG: hypothetical protein HYR56_21980 [Acidobacteria bacterium]|nr:hypothetical protein [Acidobacteriota bacterium]MBI3428287.1 hypothetical protein [Acidobacteriota bacterium]
MAEPPTRRLLTRVVLSRHQLTSVNAIANRSGSPSLNAAYRHPVLANTPASQKEETQVRRGGTKFRKSQFKLIISMELVLVWMGWFGWVWLKPGTFCSPIAPHLFWGLVQLGVIGYLLILFNSFEQSQDNIAKSIGFGGGAFFLALAAVAMSADQWATAIKPYIAAPDVACCRTVIVPALLTIGVVNFVNMFLAFQTEEIITGAAGQEISR